MKRTQVATSLIGALTILLSTPAQAATPEDPVAKARAEIEALERGIYADRAAGKLDFYVGRASPHYLAWTAGTPRPFPLATLDAGKAQMAGKNQELIDTRFDDFTMSGDTAVIYYTNHRTRMPDGRVVDQVYENIHVWIREGGQWRIIASMSRQMKG